MAKETDSKAGIIRTIKRLHRSRTSLNYSTIRHTHGPLLLKAREKFGTWKKAVEAAGIDYTKVRKIQRWSKKEIRTQLRALYEKREFRNVRVLRDKYPKLYGACLRLYGGGVAAIEATGIDYEELLDEQPHRWSKKKILALIQQRYEGGKTLSREAILRNEPDLRRFCYATLFQFKLWGNALRAAKLDPELIRNRDGLWPKPRVLKEIKARHKKGKLLNTDHMLRDDLPLHAAGRRHFGTWRKAIEAAGLNYNQHVRGGLRGWSKARTRRTLKERVEMRPGSVERIRDDSPVLFRAAVHHFGSWEEAVRAVQKRK